MRPGLAYDYRIVLEGADGRQGTTDTFRLDTEFAYPSPDLRRPSGAAGPFAALVARMPTQKGYTVVLGCHRELVLRIVQDTEMQVVVVSPDAKAVGDLRGWLDREGLYGVQVSVILSPYEKLPIGTELANAVVVATKAEVPRDEIARITRPHGGTAFDLQGETILTKGATSGAGDWTHQYGGAGNTASSRDELVSGPLELQWFGRPGPRPMMDRGARSPAPLATNGRLFIHGDRRLIALDAYNGTILWGLEIPALRRTNVPRDCSNITAHGADLFAAVVDRLWRLDGQTGALRQSYQIPKDFRPPGDPAWGFVHATEEAVIGTATTVSATYRGAEGQWYDKPGADAEDVLASALFSLDKKTGKTRWSYRNGVIVHPTITLAKDVIYFVEDRKPSKQTLAKNRLVSQTGVDQYLVAIELPTGHKVWERKYDFRKFQQAFYLSVSAGVLVAVGTSGAYHVHAFDSSTGTPMWQHSHKWKRDHHGGGLQHPVIINGVVYVEFKGLDLRKGDVLREDLPDRRGCGTMSASGNSIFFRHYDHTMWNPETNAKTTLTGIRSGCWLSLIPAGGLLLAPESSSGCSCANPIQTSVAYRPKASK
jgi:outer membrane protein assembly factor BamB